VGQGAGQAVARNHAAPHRARTTLHADTPNRILRYCIPGPPFARAMSTRSKPLRAVAPASKEQAPSTLVVRRDHRQPSTVVADERSIHFPPSSTLASSLGAGGVYREESAEDFAALERSRSRLLELSSVARRETRHSCGLAGQPRQRRPPRYVVQSRASLDVSARPGGTGLSPWCRCIGACRSLGPSPDARPTAGGHPGIPARRRRLTPAMRPGRTRR
jgi:hypothetical protein